MSSLESLLVTSNTASGWCELQSAANQRFLTRCLARVGDADDEQQRMILTVCRRALHPSRIPLWPADALLKKPRDISRLAVRLLECMPLADRAGLLPTLVTLPWAVNMIQELSDEPCHADRVAAAVCTVEYQPYMRMLGLPVLWRLIPYLREHDAFFALQRLVRAHSGMALRQGAVTHLIAHEQHAPLDIATVALSPRCLHAQIHRMYTSGRPEPGIAAALQREPRAVHALAKRWPRIDRECRWIRRRLFALCMARYRGKAASRFWDRIARLDHGPRSVIGKYL